MKKNIKASLFLVVILVLSFAFINSYDANAANFTVPGDFATIKEAVTDPSVMDGDTINVLSGTYNESRINIRKQINLVGAGIGSTIIDTGGLHGFRILSGNVLIQDLTIQNAKTGMRLNASFLTFDNIDIKRVQFLNSGVGIVVGNTTTITDMLIRDCQFENNTAGFRVSKRAHIDGARIVDSTFDNNRYGIHFANKGNDSTMNNVKIFDNTFSNHTNTHFRAGAIYLEEAQNTRIQRNMFVDNFSDIVLSKIYQPAVPMSNVLISRNTMMGTTGFVFTIYNADNGGQTVFDGIFFSLNDVMTADATFVTASAHRTGLPSAGGTGWDTVFIRANCVTGITTAGIGVTFFVPKGLDPNQALGGASLNVTKNWWGTTNIPDITNLLENPTITDIEPIRTSCTL